MRFTTLLRFALCGMVLLTPPAAMAAEEIAVSAAASLREVFDEITADFVKKNPGVAFRKNLGGSGALAKQIEQGAPADLFISANREWMEYLKERKLLDPASVGTLAYNVLVFAGTTRIPVTGMKDLAKLNKIAIGSPKSVPAGQYAAEAMKASGIGKDMAGKVVMAKDVREAMRYAEMGEVDGAFVYRTDALLMGRRARILFDVPERLHERVTYPMALTAVGSKKKGAREFFHFLQGAEARRVLQKHGFEVK